MPADFDVGNIRVPVVVNSFRFMAIFFCSRLTSAIPSLKQAMGAQDVVDSGLRQRADVFINHLVGKLSIANVGVKFPVRDHSIHFFWQYFPVIHRRTRLGS